jgi:hypothetical protein
LRAHNDSAYTTAFHDYEYEAKVCAAISHLADETPMRHRDRWIQGCLSEAEDASKIVLFHIAREGQRIVLLSEGRQFHLQRAMIRES